MKILLLMLIISGCTSIHIQKGDWVFDKNSFGSDLSIGKFSVTQKSSNNFIVQIEGLTDPQTEALKAVTEGAVKGAIAGIKP